MKKHLIILTCVICTITFGQVGINTDSPHPSSDLELASPDKALFLNRVANPEIDISSPQNGMILYDTTRQCVRAYQANAWSNCFGFSDEEPGSVTSLDCGSAIHLGTLVNDGTEYSSGIETTIPYTGGNGGDYPALTFSSAGVTGLTATLQAGTFNSGDGALTFNITGTPSGSGSAVFAINIGGQNCSFTRTVDAGTPPVGSVTTLDCNATLNPDAVFTGQSYSGTLEINYTGGNGGSYETDTFAVNGLTFTRNAGNFATGNGVVTYNVSGTPSSNGAIVIPELNIGGQSCTSLNVGVSTGFTLYCGSGSFQPVLNPDNLTAGQSYTGTYTVKYFTNSGGYYAGTSYPAESFTVNGLTFSRVAGTFVGGTVTDVTYTVSGTPINSGNMDITVNLADKTCTTTKNVNEGGLNFDPDPDNYVIPNLRAGYSYSGGLSFLPKIIIPYSGGDGSSYSGISNIYSTSEGVRNLSIETPAGNFNNGDGEITFYLRGIANTAGYAYFNFTFEGKQIQFRVYVDCGRNSSTFYSSNQITNGNYTSGHTITISYDHGDGSAYPSMNIPSMGTPSGLYISTPSGNLANGSGTITFNIQGTPNGTGPVSWNVPIAGRTCLLDTGTRVGN